MHIILRTPNGTEVLRNRTLVEETSERVYLENENKSDNDVQKYPDSKIISVDGCTTIGYISDGEENIIKAESAEQITESEVKIRKHSGEETIVRGRLDRAYTY